MRTALTVMAVAVALVEAHPADACTTFVRETDGKIAIGRNYDWDMGQGLVMVNKRGVGKQALSVGPGDRPLRWRSKHGSVTFNQFGREMPNGGMNDAGLVVDVLWLAESHFPPLDARPSVNELQLVQYLLDSFTTIAEVTKAMREVRVGSVYGKLHYFVCDVSGSCAAIELIDGYTVVTPGVKALTNSTYAESSHALKKYNERPKTPEGADSLGRFVRASLLANSAPKKGQDTTAAVFDVLDAVAQGERTQWSIVYLPAEQRVYFRTRAKMRVKSLALAHFDLSCQSPVKVLDIDADIAGDVSPKLVDYTQAANGALVAKSLAPLKDDLPPTAAEQLTAYPAMLPCSDP